MKMSFKGVVKVPANWTIDKLYPLWDPFFSLVFPTVDFWVSALVGTGRWSATTSYPHTGLTKSQFIRGPFPESCQHISHRVDELDVPFSFKKWCPFRALEMSVLFLLKIRFEENTKRWRLIFHAPQRIPNRCGRMTIAWSFGRSHTLWVWKGRYFFGSWLVLQRGRSQSGTEKNSTFIKMGGRFCRAFPVFLEEFF